jgi:tRNA dimethylallyltransferase
MSGEVRHAIVLMGPTAAGKTDLAMQLAEDLPINLISVDSALIYRGMDIGTGKPTREELHRHPHALVDILDPAESYSAGQFVRDASALIAQSHAQGRVPLLVGGTMLYVRALLKGIADMPEANTEFRAQLDLRAAQLGWPALHAELTERDPEVAARIGINDAQRIQRALEVMHVTGRRMSAIQAEARPPLPHVHFKLIGLSPADRDALYVRIARRLHAMMEAGFLDEVLKLYERGDLRADMPSMRAVGYRQLWAHLAGETTLETATERAILATRHLARRQLIWMRAEPELHWVDSLAADALQQIQALVSLPER